MMSSKLFLPFIMLLCCLQLPADVVMNLEIPRSSYMLYEPVTANLALRNTSGQVLVFGSEAELQGFMEIELTDLHDRPLPGSGTKVNLQGMILRAGTDHHIKINLSKWINLRKVGYYRIKLFISHPKLKNQYESNRCAFDVSYGKIFWQRNFGVPQLLNDPKAADKAVQNRSYTLRALQDKNNVFLFLFIEDQDKIYSIKRLGLLLGSEHAKCDIDSLNRLHILLPMSPKLFQYLVFDWNGEREERKMYRTTDRVPLLYRDAKSGEISVIGGDPAQPGVDYAEEKLLPNLPIRDSASAAKPELTPVKPPAKKR